MPGSEIPKRDYPSCNRAFALRMMNPTCYSEERTSPLDKQIQPLGKKFVAKSALSSGVGYHRDSTELLSVDEVSLSPASSCASLSEMELYDIEEHKYGPEQQMLHRQRSSLEVNNLRKHHSPKGGEYGMVRSYSSAGGFNRSSPSRTSLPSRNKNKPNNANGFKQEASAFLKTHQSASSPKGTAAAASKLRRTQSLKGGRPPAETSSPISRPRSSSGMNKSSLTSPSSKIRVAGTKSSQLRAESLKQKQESPQPQKMTRTSSSTKRGKASPPSLNSTEEESDGSVFSELDTYNPRHNPRGRTTKEVNHKAQRNSRADGGGKASSVQNISSQARRNLTTDTFGDKLNEVCRIILEKHPGDFQILETLTEMQSAYEERNDLVKDTISNLREKVRILEYKNSNSPNIPGLVIPLMRATNAFQTQLQSIMDAYHKPGVDASTQLSPDSQQYGTPLDRISEEANQVASRIEKLSVEETDSEVESLTEEKDTELEKSAGSDKENICDEEQEEHGEISSSFTTINNNEKPVNV